MCKFTHFFVSHMSVSSPFATINKQQGQVQRFKITGARPPLLKLRGACAPLAPVVPTPCVVTPFCMFLHEYRVVAIIASELENFQPA